jgi:hypothetical protein
MIKSYSKIRHIEKTNLMLENRSFGRKSLLEYDIDDEKVMQINEKYENLTARIQTLQNENTQLRQYSAVAYPTATGPTGCDSSTSSLSEPGPQGRRLCREKSKEQMENNLDDQDGHSCQSGRHDDAENTRDEDDDDKDVPEGDEEDVTNEENVDSAAGGTRGNRGDIMREEAQAPNGRGRQMGETPVVRGVLQPFSAVELARARGKRKHHPDRKQHVTDRIQMYVKAHIFRKVKFVQNDNMLMDIMVAVERTEKFRDQRSRDAFKSVYKGVVMEAINVRRSACDQAGCKIVCQYLSSRVFDDGCGNETLIADDLPIFTLDTICKLRQATTDKEVRAFQWFFGEFLECVSGKRVWSRHKYHTLISEAVNRDTGVQIITVSDEAFGLLLLENYMEKWKRKFVAKANGVVLEKKLDGKFTASTKGNFVFGGWSKAGQKQFNFYVNMVKADRSGAGARQMETNFLSHMQHTPIGQKIYDKMQSRMSAAERRGEDSAVESDCDVYIEPL